jgi:hypothetical protein
MVAVGWDAEKEHKRPGAIRNRRTATVSGYVANTRESSETTVYKDEPDLNDERFPGDVMKYQVTQAG